MIGTVGDVCLTISRYILQTILIWLHRLINIKKSRPTHFNTRLVLNYILTPAPHLTVAPLYVLSLLYFSHTDCTVVLFPF